MHCEKVYVIGDDVEERKKIIDSYKKGTLKAQDYVFDRDVFVVLGGRLK